MSIKAGQLIAVFVETWLKKPALHIKTWSMALYFRQLANVVMPKCQRAYMHQGLCYHILSQAPTEFLVLVQGCHGKCFTYVAKPIANLTTYSRKPGNYNGTIIFEFDIMKNSSQLNLKFTYFATVKTKITLFFCWTKGRTHNTLRSASKCDRLNQNKRNNQKICEKVKFDKDLN